jgi:DNA-binding response OmpR family regulator
MGERDNSLKTDDKQSSKASERGKILIIDDDIDFVDSTRALLKDRYEVITANSGDEGWSKLNENPDLVILDVLMNRRGEGFIFCRKMRKDERFSGIPVIMLTSMRQQTGFSFLKDDPRDERFLPVDEFLEKPVQPSELILKIEKLLKDKRKKTMDSI